MKNRCLTLNLSNITGDPRKHNLNIQFRIKDVKDGQGITEITKYELITGHIKRLVRRGRKKVDASFVLRSGDGKRSRVKVIIITNTYVHKSTETSLRASSKDILRDVISKNTFEKTIEELLRGEIQKEGKKVLSKIAPVRNFEIRVFKAEPSRKEKEDYKEEIEVVEEKTEEVKEETEEVAEEEAEAVEEKTEETTKEEKKEKPKKEIKKKEEKKTVKKKTTPKKKLVNDKSNS